jgi:hypothetical protein
MASIGLDVDIATENPLFVRNNLAELGVTGRLDVRGDLASPAPFGRLDVQEGGKVFLQTREFTVESGSLVYTGTLEPEIAIQAKTVITQPGDSDVEVTIKAEGPLMSPKLDLTSQPEYSEKEIASLVATGRRTVTLDNTAWVAGEQAATLLAGRLSRRFERGLAPLGFDEVTIQPHLLAREADPSARFTFAKHLTPRLRLIYSIGLNDAEIRYVEGQYRLQLGRFHGPRGPRRGDLTYGVGRAGSSGAARHARHVEAGQVRLADVRVQGDGEILAGRLPRQAGDQVTPWDLLGDAEELEASAPPRGPPRGDRLQQPRGTRPRSRSTRVLATSRRSGLTSPPDLRVTSSDPGGEAFDNGRKRVLEAARGRVSSGRGWRRASTSTTGRVLVFDVDPAPRSAGGGALPGASAWAKASCCGRPGAGALLTSGRTPASAS